MMHPQDGHTGFSIGPAKTGFLRALADWLDSPAQGVETNGRTLVVVCLSAISGAQIGFWIGYLL